MTFYIPYVMVLTFVNYDGACFFCFLFVRDDGSFFLSGDVCTKREATTDGRRRRERRRERRRRRRGSSIEPPLRLVPSFFFLVCVRARADAKRLAQRPIGRTDVCVECASGGER